MNWWPWTKSPSSVPTVDRRQLDALREAARQGDWKRVFDLLQDADVALLEGSEEHEPMLVWALTQNEEMAAMRLLELGANPNATRRDGRPVLLLAIERCPEEVVQALLQHGADPNAATPSGTPALAVALRQEKCEVLLTLNKAGAQVDEAVRQACSPYLGKCSAVTLYAAKAVGLCSAGQKAAPVFYG